MNKGLLLVVCGPSGVGKGTICKQLLQSEPDICISVSATTRAPRVGEVDGVSYYFIHKETFEEWIEEDQFLEHAKVYDNYYGTPKKYVLEKISQGKNVLLEIDVQGALQIMDKYPEGIFVFILPPSLGELKSRIIKRGTESEESIQKRFKSAMAEIEFVNKYDYYVINDDVDCAVDKIKSIMKAEKIRVTADIDQMISKYKEEI